MDTVNCNFPNVTYRFYADVIAQMYKHRGWLEGVEELSLVFPVKPVSDPVQGAGIQVGRSGSPLARLANKPCYVFASDSEAISTPRSVIARLDRAIQGPLSWIPGHAGG